MESRQIEEITKIERVRGVNGMVLEEKQLTVKAYDLAEAEKVFDSKWKKC